MTSNDQKVTCSARIPFLMGISPRTQINLKFDFWAPGPSQGHLLFSSFCTIPITYLVSSRLPASSELVCSYRVIGCSVPEVVWWWLPWLAKHMGGGPVEPCVVMLTTNHSCFPRLVAFRLFFILFKKGTFGENTPFPCDAYSREVIEWKCRALCFGKFQNLPKNICCIQEDALNVFLELRCCNPLFSWETRSQTQKNVHSSHHKHHKNDHWARISAMVTVNLPTMFFSSSSRLSLPLSLSLSLPLSPFAIAIAKTLNFKNFGNVGEKEMN